MLLGSVSAAPPLLAVAAGAAPGFAAGGALGGAPAPAAGGVGAAGGSAAGGSAGSPPIRVITIWSVLLIRRRSSVGLLAGKRTGGPGTVSAHTAGSVAGTLEAVSMSAGSLPRS